MATKYEKAVQEDINRGHGSVSVTMPGGGSATGSKVGVHSFFGESYVNVKDFGAIGNDGHDDTSAFQAAIDNVTAAQILWVPPGIYRHTGLLWRSQQDPYSDAVQPAVCTRIEGHGMGTSVLKYIGSGTALQPDNHAANPPSLLTNAVHLRRLGIINGGAVGSTIGIDQPVSQYCRIEDCKIRGFSIGQRMGIRSDEFGAAFFNRTDDCVFENNTTHVSIGYFQSGKLTVSNANWWRNNVFSNGTTGIIVNNGNGNTIASNAFGGMTTAIYVDRGTYNAVRDNYIDSTVTGVGITTVAGHASTSLVLNNLNDAATPYATNGYHEILSDLNATQGFLQCKSVPIAWCTFRGSDGLIFEAMRVTSITRTAAGRYTVNLSTTLGNMKSEQPAVIVTGDDAVAGYWGRFAFSTSTLGSSSSAIKVEYVNAAGTFIDPGRLSVMLMGGIA